MARFLISDHDHDDRAAFAPTRPAGGAAVAVRVAPAGSLARSRLPP